MKTQNFKSVKYFFFCMKTVREYLKFEFSNQKYLYIHLCLNPIKFVIFLDKFHENETKVIKIVFRIRNNRLSRQSTMMHLKP